MAADDDRESGDGPGGPWESRRGLETTDYNNIAVLICTSIDEAARALAGRTERWERDVLGKEIGLSPQGGAFVFRLRGHNWTIVVLEPLPLVWLSEIGEQEISRQLKTKVIAYWVSDTSGGIGYQLYENGELMEKLSAIEGDDEHSSFSSRLRDLKKDDIKNGWSFTRQFFIEQDAFEPGIDFRYFLGSRDYRPGDRVRIENPGFVLVMPGSRRLLSTPPIERVDYLALRVQPPGQALGLARK